MSIQPVVMPKWGLAMEEGTLTKWSVAPGQSVSKGEEIAEIETTKIANVFESPAEGTIRRLVATEGETLSVGALLAVIADPSAPDVEVDAFVAKFQSEFTPLERSADGGPATRTLEAGGLTIRVLSVGEGAGTPVLLVHGFGSDLTAWLFTQEALAEERAVHAFDLPGHGASTKAVETGSVADLAVATLKVMDALGLDKAHLVGHSLGGAISAHLAATRPDRVATVSLIASAGLGREINGEFIDSFITEMRARKLRAVLQNLVSDPSLISADMVEEVIKFKRLDGSTAALRRIADANFGGGVQSTLLRDALAATVAPVVVIVGEEDRIIPPTHAEGLPTRIPVTRVAGAGHLPHMERSAEVNEAIRANIARGE